MIITRSPLRISLGGGGTDLPSYYQSHGGFVIAAAIDKYVYITLHRRFVPKLLLKYSQHEEVDRVDEIKHPLIRESIRQVDPSARSLEISSAADIPAGTGLGSSGSFTTALLKALHVDRKDPVAPDRLAERACRVEIDVLGEPVGKQDQYIAAHGGLTCFRFLPEGRVESWPLKVDPHTLYDLEDNLLLFFTGYTRSASEILREQDTRSRRNDREMTDNLDVIKRIGLDTKAALESGDLARFAALMNAHWEHKKRRSPGMSNGPIDRWYEIGMRQGALGGKLIGAGGGGFLLFYAEDRVRLRQALHAEGLQEVRFCFEFEGTKVIIQH
ncbi:MAG: galactokinase [Planctomycetia bacterium]|nr:galactokinase [Planctomycetia bacterium]